ncbi:MAG: hypothetical protein AB8B63_20680 [Granulosicoccus sp.]
MGKSRYQAAASTSSNTWPHVDARSVPIMALVLMFGLAAFLIFSREEAPVADPAVVNMAAANPVLDKPAEEPEVPLSAALLFQQDTQENLVPRQSASATDKPAHQTPTKTGMVVTDGTASAKRPASLWRSKHLANRHYAAITSQSDNSELSYLCIEGVSCGWILNLKNEKTCNNDSKGKVFSVRVQSSSLVRDFESKCIAYGLVNLALDAGEKPQLTSMIKTSESLVFSSVGSTVIFRSQRYDFPDSVDAINSARVAADINQDNRSL